MGKGQRHSKNAGVMGSEGLSYAEKKALGFGTVRERLGKEAHGNFNDCCLTLQPAIDPVVTPHGYLYSKEAILENLLAQKKSVKRKLAAWEAEQEEERQRSLEIAAIEEEAKLIAFDRQNHMGISETTARGIQAAIQEEAAHMHDSKAAKSVVAIRDHADRMKEMKAFWLPSKTPEAKKTLDKPDQNSYCPASGKKLRMKDLMPVNFCKVPGGREGEYMDPITKDTFTNATRLVVLQPSGDVVSFETYKTCIKPEGEYKGHRLKDKDVIELQTSATGFVGRDGAKVEAQKAWTLGPGSGLTDLRGQHKGPRSHGGLVFWN